MDMSLTGQPHVSGCYHGVSGPFSVELRVDVDGVRPTGAVSADYEHAGVDNGSMRIDDPVIVVREDHVAIRGTATFSTATAYTTVKVTIPRVPPGTDRAPATLTHFTSHGALGSSFTCEFHTESFRTVVFEEAYQRGLRRFTEYDTSLLPSSGPHRMLSAAAAFAEAGIALESDRDPALVN